MLEVTGGIVIGLCLGYLSSKVLATIDDPQVEITLTTVLAYGSYLLAQSLQLSGVIASVSAGLMLGPEVRIARKKLINAEKSSTEEAQLDGLISPRTADKMIEESDRQLDHLANQSSRLATPESAVESNCGAGIVGMIELNC